MAEPHDPYAALRIPDYRRLLACGVLASVAMQVQEVALGWDLYVRTNSPALLGLVGLVEFLPALLLALPAGHAADRYDLKILLSGALLLTALSSVGLTALAFFDGPVLLIYVCVALVGVGHAFTSPPRWALLPAVVPEELLGSAVTWNSSSWQIASVAGPALGGIGLWATDGKPSGIYLFAALLSLASAAVLIRIRPRPMERHSEAMSLDSLLAGLRFVFKTELILAAITLDMFAVLLGGATALLPVFAKDILDVGPAWLGWLRAAPSIGALVMAVVLAHRPPLRRAGRTLMWSVAGFGAATVGFGLSRNPYLSFAALALTGALDNVSVVVRGTLVQLLTPDAMRGRVAAVNSIFIGTSNEVGAFESGITAWAWGPVKSVVFGGIGSILVVLAVTLRWPRMLRVRSLADLTAPPEVASRAITAAVEVFDGADASMAIGAIRPAEERPPL
jgi:MFS family permease